MPFDAVIDPNIQSFTRPTRQIAISPRVSHTHYMGKGNDPNAVCTTAPMSATLLEPDQVAYTAPVFDPDDQMCERIRASLTDELRKPPWRGSNNLAAGHCYVASEAYFHLKGGKEAGYKPMRIRHEGSPHWFVANPDGTYTDLTADQFRTPVPYEQGVGCGFLTREPSARARTVMQRALQCA